MSNTTKTKKEYILAGCSLTDQRGLTSKINEFLRQGYTIVSTDVYEHKIFYHLVRELEVEYIQSLQSRRNKHAIDEHDDYGSIVCGF